MANLTLSIDDDVLRHARMRALERGTTVNSLVRDYLESFVGGSPSRRALAMFLARTEETTASSGQRGREWTRDDMYD